MPNIPIVYDADRLANIRTLYGDSCNVLFLSNAALSAMNKAIENMLWPTRWHGGKRGQELPAIARELYEELTMNLCTVEALGEAIGQALTMTINVNNNQAVSTCCDGGVGTVNDDGSINQPPYLPPPESWGGDFPAILPDKTCELAYACWEYGEVILSMLKQLRSILIVVGVVAAIVAAVVPASWAVLLAGGSVVSLTAALSSLTAQSMIITNSVTAGESWQSDKDAIICGFKESLTENATSVENQFLSAMIAVYGNLLDGNDLQELVDVLASSAIGDFLQDAIFDGGDFSPQNMPADYDCSCELDLSCLDARTESPITNMTLTAHGCPNVLIENVVISGGNFSADLKTTSPDCTTAYWYLTIVSPANAYVYIVEDFTFSGGSGMVLGDLPLVDGMVETLYNTPLTSEYPCLDALGITGFDTDARHQWHIVKASVSSSPQTYHISGKVRGWA